MEPLLQLSLSLSLSVRAYLPGYYIENQLMGFLLPQEKLFRRKWGNSESPTGVVGGGGLARPVESNSQLQTQNPNRARDFSFFLVVPYCFFRGTKTGFSLTPRLARKYVQLKKRHTNPTAGQFLFSHDQKVPSKARKSTSCRLVDFFFGSSERFFQWSLH
jgi:hypothetical protein